MAVCSNELDKCKSDLLADFTLGKGSGRPFSFPPEGLRAKQGARTEYCFMKQPEEADCRSQSERKCRIILRDGKE
jgi:hypothetical protein